MINSEELISVVIPTYKNRGGLMASIDSVLNQTYSNIEVIVVDDNSPESEDRKNTMVLMQKYVNNPKVIYICHEYNKNGAAARNTGIKASKGNYIAFLDDDDIFLKDKLTKQLAYLKGHPECNAVYCLACRGRYGCSQRVIEGDGTRDILLLQSNFFTPSLMFYRETLEAINGFDETFRRHQDYELLLRYFSAGYKIGCVPEILIEIGVNMGENIPTGKKVDDLKAYFFSKFHSFIQKEDLKTPGFAKEVYAKHYAGVFLSHVKTKNFFRAIKVFIKYFNKAPVVFTKVLYTSLKLHITN